MIRVELSKLLRSRRTWATVAIVNLLPMVVAVLLAVTELGPRPGEGPAFLSAVLTDGTLYPLAALAIVLPLFLPIAVAIQAGDAIAGESQTGTLRYLLIRPVGRLRLLLAKLVGIAAFVVLTVSTVAGIAYVMGISMLGTQSLTTGATSVSGTTLSTAELVGRTALAFGFAMLCMMAIAAMAMFFSTLTDSPLGAAMATIAIFVGSTLLLTLDAADSFRDYLPTRYWLAFVDLFRDPIFWREIVRGVLSQSAYVVTFTLAAWANFASKDVAN